MHVKKNQKPIEKTGYPAGYPVSGNLRISEFGFSKPIRYPGSKSVSGTTLIDTYLKFKESYSIRI